MVDDRTVAFAQAARGFCGVVDTSPLDTRATLTALLRLLVTAQDLPDTRPTFDDTSTTHAGITADTVRVATNVHDSLGSAERYRVVFDPHSDEEPCAGSLADDLGDIYRDVRRGLDLFDREAPADAAWEWRFAYETHWGAHATDAVRVLHRLVHG